MTLISVGASPITFTDSPLHDHDCYEVIVNTVGEGTARIGSEMYPFSPGTIHIIPPNIIHKKNSEKGFRDIYFHTDSLSVNDIAGNLGKYSRSPVILPDDACHTVEKLVSILLERWLRNGYDEITFSIYSVIMRQIEEWMNSAIQDIVVDEIIHIIANSYSDPDFMVTNALAQSGYCTDHIRRRFRDSVGKTPNEYLQSIRIQHAKELLGQKRSLNLPINEVAWLCGFHDAAYFCRCFRRDTGMTPSAYMKKHSS